MPNREILMMASVMALIRGEVTVRGIAERFGVTEAQVLGWKDVFEIAGILALAEVICGTQSRAATRKRPGKSRLGKGTEPTTPSCDEPTTTPEPCPEKTTTPEPWSEPTTFGPD